VHGTEGDDAAAAAAAPSAARASGTTATSNGINSLDLSEVSTMLEYEEDYDVNTDSAQRKPILLNRKSSKSSLNESLNEETDFEPPRDDSFA